MHCFFVPLDRKLNEIHEKKGDALKTFGSEQTKEYAFVDEGYRRFQASSNASLLRGKERRKPDFSAILEDCQWEYRSSVEPHSRSGDGRKSFLRALTPGLLLIDVAVAGLARWSSGASFTAT